jgi:hypothetical protein
VARRNREGASCPSNRREGTMDKKTLKVAKESRLELKERVDENNYSLGHFTLGTKGNIKHFINKPCFADLTYGEAVPPEGGWSFFINYVSPTKRQDDMCLKHTVEDELSYLDWLINNSHWNVCIEDSDPEVVRDKGIIFNTEHSAQFTVAAANLHRYLSEKPTIIPMWNRFKNRGVDPHLSLLLAHVAYPSSDNTYALNPYFGSGHTIFQYSYTNKETIENLLKGNVVRQNDKAFRFSVRFGGMNQMWNKTKNEKAGIKTEIKSEKKVIRKNDWGEEVESLGYEDKHMLRDSIELLKLNGIEEKKE